MDSALRRFVFTGGAVGAAFGLLSPFLMDFLLHDALRSTWKETIASDLKLLFSLDVPVGGFIVMTAMALIMLVMGLFGALMGVSVSCAVFRFILFLNRE